MYLLRKSARSYSTSMSSFLLRATSRYCHDVRPSVCLSGIAGMHCDHTVQFSVDLSLWLDSPMFWPPWHQSMSTYSEPSFASSTWNRGGVWINAN